MAVAENGHLVNGSKDKPNGHAVGYSTSTRRRSRPRRSWSSWFFNNVARLSIWYALITVVFRCPSDPKRLTDQSPRVCGPYLTARTNVQPYVQPYYDAYAEPYVVKAKPYIDIANKQVIQPASAVLLTNYAKYAVPQIEKAKTLAYGQWDQHIRPQLGVAQDRASLLYSNNLEPHVAKASAAVGPYYEVARDNARDIHQKHVIPAIIYSRPHLETAYANSQKFVLGTALPAAQYAWSHILIFVDGTLWPFVKTVYSDNVRPQLVMISERIAKYQESRKLQAVLDEVDSSLSASSTSVADSTTTAATTTATNAAETLSSFMASIIEDASSAVEQVSSSILPQPTKEVEYATDESVKEDLVKWQKKFAIAADKGTEDLRHRIRDIIDSLVRSDVDSEGRGLAKALEKTCDVQIGKIKSKIVAVVHALPDEATQSEEEAAAEEVLRAVRESGSELRDRARAVRDWELKFQQELTRRTETAASTTLQVLDSIRDLGLQEIGMRWAWMEGVTYLHWEKYHDLRQRFDEWRDEVRDVAVQHHSVEAARDLAELILEDSMSITETTAKELFRLKDVAKWKIRARDTTDDFEDRVIPAAVVSAASKVAGKVEDLTSSIAGTTQGSVESLASKASETFSSISSSMSAAANEQLSGADSVISGATSIASDGAASVSVAADEAARKIKSLTDEAASSASSASSSLIGSSTGMLESVASGVSSSVSSAVIGTSTGAVEQASSSASSFVQDAYESASSLVGSAGSSNTDSIASDISVAAKDAFVSASESASSAASAASSKVFAGAMAQVVGGQIPILDDVFDDDEDIGAQFSASVQNFMDEAGDKYAQITDALSEALYGTSQGTVESLTSLANERYMSALSAASSALYGTPTPVTDSIVDAAVDSYKQAVAAASSVIYAPKPTQVGESLLRQASSVYSEAISRAAEYSSAAAEVVSKQISGTPKPIHSQMIESIAAAYAGSVAQASARLDQVVNAASGQYASLSSAAAAAYPTQGQLQSISSVASSRLQAALAAASSQYLTAKVAVGATPTPIAMQAQQNYYAAVGYAHEQYSNFVSAGSSAVYGTPTPAYQYIIDSAASQYSAASMAASSSLDAYLSSVSSIASKATKTKGPAQSLLDEAAASYSSLVSAASDSFLSASEQASIAILGTQAAAYERVLSSASSQYAAATSAAAENLNSLVKSASSAVGKKDKSPAQSILDSISSRYGEVLVAASATLAAASVSASSAFYGPAPGSFEHLSSVASGNWEALVAQASERIYGQPTPVWASVTSQVQEYTSQATNAAAEQFLIIQHFVSELVVGKEPDFTESVMSRLSSAYYTGVAGSASSLASEAYASGVSIASSISSVASAFFTPPPEIESILDSVNSQLNAAVEAASVQVYGTSKGSIEKAASAAADAYSSASSAVSEGVYGTAPGYGEVASSSFAAAARSASEAISLAIYGTPTGSLQSASSAAASQYDRISSAMASSVAEATEKAASVAEVARSKVSEALYGPEQNALESAQAKILEAVESARVRIAELSAQASDGAVNAANIIGETVASIASDVSETVSSATARVKDEL